MTNYFIKFADQAELIDINDRMYFHYVSEDGVNFKPPFMAGTLTYLQLNDTDNPSLPNPWGQHVDFRMEEYATIYPPLATILLNKKNTEDAIIAGWWPAPEED